jgi:SLBB domain./Helix-hairpin-helix motif.
MSKKYLIVIFSCLFITVAGICYSCSYNKEHGQEVLVTSLEDGRDSEKFGGSSGEKITDGAGGDSKVNVETADEGPELIYVHLCGAVANPDVYRVEAGSRLVDIIELAGGLSPEAAGDYVNQAMVVEDGQRIYIPTKDELKDLALTDYMQGAHNSKSDDDATDSKVNINTADENTLMSLPGIGQARAKSIIEYRDKNGGFSDIKDLMNVPGIKEGCLTGFRIKLRSAIR